MPLTAAIVVVSDRCARREREDRTGPAVRSLLQEAGWEVLPVQLVPDELDQIRAALLRLCAEGKANLILTAGGTGLGPRDVTPEATEQVIERKVPGICEAIRARSLVSTPNAMLSRATAGIRGHHLILNLPGSPQGAAESLAIALPVLTHAVEILHGAGHDCQLVSLDAMESECH